MKTSKIIEVYKTLKEAKLTKMESVDKFQVIKIMRSLKPHAEEWDTFASTVDEKLRGENHEAIMDKIKQWQQEGDKTTLSLDERREVNEYIARFNAERTELINAEMAKEVEVSFGTLSEDAFERLVESNDFNVSQIMTLQEAIC